MTITAMANVLESASPERLGIDPAALERLYAQIEGHIAAGRYPGAAVAMARHGKLVAARSFGVARQAGAGQEAVAASDTTLWLLYSQTKPVVSSAIWQLIERGKLRFHDTIAEYLPEFKRNGKGKVTIHQLLSHQGGFPGSGMSPEAWENHELMRETVCGYTLEWEPGARVVYHGAAAHWTQAALIEAVTGQDYRDYVRENITGALGLRHLCVGVPDELHDQCAFMYQPSGEVAGLTYDQNAPAHWRAGVPGGGGYATAIDLTTFYQMLLNGGTLNGVRIVSPRMVEYVTRNHTADWVDGGMGMPMHRGMGVHVRGTTATIRGLGSIASPSTFGHGGAGSSYSWADPETGVSFTYLTNARVDEPWHSQRLDEVGVMSHAAVVEL